KVPMSTATLGTLTALAEKMSTAERKISPMQVAAQLLEEAVGRVEVEPGMTAGLASPTPARDGANSGQDAQHPVCEDGARVRELVPADSLPSQSARHAKSPGKGRKPGHRRKKV